MIEHMCIAILCITVILSGITNQNQNERIDKLEKLIQTMVTKETKPK